MIKPPQDWSTWTTVDLLAHQAQLVATFQATPNVLRGSVVLRFTRCGKASCHCARGESEHPHYYLSTRQEGRTHMDYIPVAWLAWVRSQVETYRQWQQTGITLTAINQELFRRRIRDGEPR